LLGLPLLLLAEIVIDPAIRRAVAEFVHAGIVPPDELLAYEKVLRNIHRVRDSAIPELLLLAPAFFPVFMFQHEWAGGRVQAGIQPVRA
jgi:hypothetical protein